MALLRVRPNPSQPLTGADMVKVISVALVVQVSENPLAEKLVWEAQESGAKRPATRSRTERLARAKGDGKVKESTMAKQEAWKGRTTYHTVDFPSFPLGKSHPGL